MVNSIFAGLKIVASDKLLTIRILESSLPEVILFPLAPPGGYAFEVAWGSCWGAGFL